MSTIIFKIAFDDYHGEYKDLGLVCEGDKSGTSFNAQFTSVIQVNGQYIACADRWMPGWWVPLMARQIVSVTARHFKDYKPDLSPRKAEPLPEKEMPHTENTSISRYVWLPMEWDRDKPVIRWKKEWTV